MTTDVDIFEAPPPPLPRRRFPMEPLLARFGGNTEALAKAAGVSQRSIQRWTRQGGLTYLRADRLCCKVHEIAPHVWLDWHLDDPIEDPQDS